MDVYFSIALFALVSLVMACTPLLLSFLFAPSNPSEAKSAAYECGFPPIGEARMPFDVRYYLVALLFLLFDIETAFLFPWALVLRELGFEAWCLMMLFLTLLTTGFWYEWQSGALKWS